MPRYEVLMRRTVHQWVTLEVEAKSELAAKRLAFRAARARYLSESTRGVTLEEDWGWDEPVGKPALVTMTTDEEVLADAAR
jgi:hypothetical protein